MNASNLKLEVSISGSRFGKNCTFRHQEIWLVVEVEHVKTHRTKKEKRDMSSFENFVTESNEKADELANEGALLDEGFKAVLRAETVQQEREKIHAALQYAASFHCLVAEWKDCEELNPKPKEKWTFVDPNGVMC